MIFTINSECGLKRDFEAADVEEAKEIYEREFQFDFAGCSAGEYPGSWYWIADDSGSKVESCAENMP